MAYLIVKKQEKESTAPSDIAIIAYKCTAIGAKGQILIIYIQKNPMTIKQKEAFNIAAPN